MSAPNAAQAVAGVQGIANDIVVKLPQESARTDPGIAAIAVMTLKHNVTVPSGGIKGIDNNLAIRRRALADCGKVQVGCDGGVVRLEGQVHSAQDRQQVVSAAWQGRGVMQVIDNLKVVPI